jgi:hypothetical protein
VYGEAAKEKDYAMASSARTQSEQITSGQIGQIQDRLGTKLRDSGLPAEGVQQALKAPGGAIIDEMVAVIRKHVEANSDLIVRRVPVDRTRSPKAAFEATTRKLYLNDSVVAAMPRGEGEEAEVVFFKVGRYVSDADLDKEYELRGLTPADPYSQAAVNEADPAFADDRPNGTHWKDSSGKWCYAFFRRWSDEREVGVYRNDGGWNDGWWFAGLRK